VHWDDGAVGTTRVAYAIPKRVGGAVVRNRIRRRLRAVLAELGRRDPAALPDGVLLVSVGPEAVGRSARDLRNDVEGLLLALDARRQGGGR
jgi:ribonuclease P protein component